MENDVAMWACLNALGFSVYKADFAQDFGAYIDIYDQKRISSHGDTIYEAAKNLYDKILNIKARDI